MTALRFVWWNVQDFAHFNLRRVRDKRWPASVEAYGEKLQRVETVLRNLWENDRPPDLVALAEITEEAAHDLRDRIQPEYQVYSLASLYTEPDFHIAILYNPAVGFGEEDFLAVSNVPNTTRPMAVLDFNGNGFAIRFFVCHWTARFEDKSEKWRQISALHLSSSVYDYLHNGGSDEERHVVILGDLNEEPYGLVERWLYANRDRATALRREHYVDKHVKRVRLYNCSWRLLGEHHPHPRSPEQRQMAGSYYWREKKTWHAFDQVIVSGSLLKDALPYLDEASLYVASQPHIISDDVLGNDHLPHKFEWNGDGAIGVSDHLPLCGKIVLDQENNNVPV